MTAATGPPAPPRTSFASDNAAGVLPEVMDAIVAANTGPSVAYGDDDWTAGANDAVRQLFGPDADVAMCWGGTGANVVGLQLLLRPWQGVICVEGAHINVDECGAAERMIGSKLLAVSTAGKLTPDDIDAAMGVKGNQHHVQPGAVSISQSTESGELYEIAEIAEITDTAHAHGLAMHIDGARLANAAAALGCTPAAMTTDLGVDVVSVGGTKAGGMYGDAVVVPGGGMASELAFVRKQFAQLPSKMRFIAVQFAALFEDELWIRRAAHANEMASALAERVAVIEGVVVRNAPVVNAVFAEIPPAALAPLQEWSFFWEWDPRSTTVRWMTSYDTTLEDVDGFAEGIAWFVHATR